MKSKRRLMIGRAWGGMIVALAIGFALTGPLPAWGVERLVLRFEGGLGGLGVGIYGTGTVVNRIKGEAWLQAGKGGQWQGIGNMTVRTEAQATPGRGVKISPATAPEKSFKVTAKVKAGKLEFYFESKPIELKGMITFVAPPPVGTVNEPYTLSFDTATIAPGPPAVTDIEMEDGAVKTIDYSKIPSFNPTISGAMVFRLNNVEEWFVTVKGLEKDAFQPPIKNAALKPPATELDLLMTFDWSLIGRFYISGGKTSPTYYEGMVFSASYEPKLYFDFQDLYRCFFLPSCGNQAGEMSTAGVRDIGLTGKPLAGQVTGGGVKLTWPEYFPKECVHCKPKKMYLGNVFVARTFGTMEFLAKISTEILPLKDGATVKGNIKDWLTYTIVMTKAKK